MKAKKGFTLIELLIVITIIGILAVAFLPSLIGAPAKARDTQRLAMINKIGAKLSTNSIVGALPATGCITTGGAFAGTMGNYFTIEDFGGVIPADPSGITVGNTTSGALGCDFLYIKDPGGAAANYSFGVYTHLEGWETGNLVCPNTGLIADDKLYTIVEPSPTVGATGPTYCFGMLVP